MHKFSRFCVFVFLGVAFLFVSVPVDVHAQSASLNVRGDTGVDKFYTVGSTVSVIFQTTDFDRSPAVGVKLIITHSGLTDVTISNGGVTAAAGFADIGTVTVTGTIAADSNVYIQAEWQAQLLWTGIGFNVEGAPLIITPAAIVVNPPDPKSPLAVGDVFRQIIEIQDVTDLASWQMDIAFNPEVLEVVDISEGDFLEQDGGDTLFLNEHSSGKIAVKQVRVGGIGVPMSGVSGSGVLVALSFRFVSFSEALLGLHNVRLSDSSGERLSYSVTLTPVVATHAFAGR